MQHPCLILTADYRPKSILPLSTIPWRESFRLYFLKKITVLEWYDEVVHTPTTTYNIPALAVIKRFSYNKSDKSVRFTRQNIFLRDMFTCAYCDEVFEPYDLTVDHVIPTSKGGQNNWWNCTTSCKSCNTRKGNTIGVFTPLRQPFKPDVNNLSKTTIMEHQIRHESWRPYLQGRPDQ